MPLENTPRPLWLTFDCYGTLIQWDEGLRAAIDKILDEKGDHQVDRDTLLSAYDHHEHTHICASPQLDRVPELFKSVGW